MCANKTKIYANCKLYWSYEDTDKLISLYHSTPVLWDVKNENYSKKNQRQRALEHVKSELDNSYTGKKIVHN